MLVSLLTLRCPEQLSGGYLHHCRLAELAGDHDAEVEFVPCGCGRPLHPGHGDLLLVESIAAWLVAPWAQRAANRRRSPTRGIEDEFLVVHPGSRAPEPAGTRIAARAAQILGDSICGEFTRYQIEVRTPPCIQPVHPREALLRLRRAAVAAATAEGLRRCA